MNNRHWQLPSAVLLGIALGAAATSFAQTQPPKSCAEDMRVIASVLQTILTNQQLVLNAQQEQRQVRDIFAANTTERLLQMHKEEDEIKQIVLLSGLSK